MYKSTAGQIASVFIALFALVGAPLLAGVVFQVETTYHSGSGGSDRKGPEGSRMSVEGSNLKMEILPGGDAPAGGVKDEVVFRGDRRQMVVVDHRDKAYMVIDGEAVRNLGGQLQGQMQQAMKDLEKRLEGLDPKQREMMEKMLKGKMGQTGVSGATPKRSPSEFRNTGERATKQGYPCVRYEVLRGGEKVSELWVTGWGNIKGGDEVVDAFKEMASFYGELMDSLENTMGPSLGGFWQTNRNPVESFTKVDGFPVVTRSFEGGELESETVLESVTERDLDPTPSSRPRATGCAPWARSRRSHESLVAFYHQFPLGYLERRLEEGSARVTSGAL